MANAKKQIINEPACVEIGKTNKVQAKNGDVLELNYIGIKNGRHIFHSPAGRNYFYAAKLWDMSPDHRYVQTNKRGFIPVEKLYIKIDTLHLKGLVRKVRR